jgi:ATP adenylyltransferase
MEFIRGEKKSGCFLCEAAAMADRDKEHLVVRRGKRCFCLLNRYPYNNGHLLVVPYRHEAQLEELSCEEMCDMLAMTVEAKRTLDSLMDPHGYNVGFNLGRAAGAGVDDHLHLHVVPRWSGDTNFMTALGSTKVIPQALEECWNMVSVGWKPTPPPESPSC